MNTKIYQNHKRIGVEVKSPYPDLSNPENIYYDIRPRNVPQVEAEMIALEAGRIVVVMWRAAEHCSNETKCYMKTCGPNY